jgi:Phytanoyl-CoA dioxygenase (PhyH)
VSTVSEQSRTTPAADRAQLRERGYTVVQRLFGTDEITQLRQVALETIDELERRHLTVTDAGCEGVTRASNCDLLSIPSLRGVLLDRRLLGVIGELLGGQPSYFGDSSLRVGKNGARAWHRDNVDRVRWRRGPDWNDPYPLLRCGLYMQDQARHSGGLALRPGSNRANRLLPTVPKLVEANAGDLVVWDLRTVHSGEVVRPRGLPWLALHPRLQTRLADGVRLPEDGQRIVLFMTFGLPSAHLDHFIAYGKTRDYMRDSWAGSRFGPEVWKEAEHAGLDVMRPVPTYGTPSGRAAD